MEKVDISVKKSKTTQFEGPFYIREIDPDGIIVFFDRISKPDADENAILIQMTLCGSDKKPLFQPKHVTSLKSKMNGIDWMKVLLVNKKINPVGELLGFQEKYLKNSESDLGTD